MGQWNSSLVYSQTDCVILFIRYKWQFSIWNFELAFYAIFLQKKPRLAKTLLQRFKVRRTDVLRISDIILVKSLIQNLIKTKRVINTLEVNHQTCYYENNMVLVCLVRVYYLSADKYLQQGDRQYTL